jgi:hypothetical protein
MAVLVQFNGRLLISVVWSKIENKFLITYHAVSRHVLQQTFKYSGVLRHVNM